MSAVLRLAFSLRLQDRLRRARELLHAGHLKRRLVACLEDNRWCNPCIKGLPPSTCAEAPTIACTEPGEPAARGDKVVAPRSGVGEKVVGHAGADHMNAGIIGACVAEAIAVEPGLMRRRAGLKRAADYIAIARAGRLSGCAEAAVLGRSGAGGGGRRTGCCLRCRCRRWLGAVVRAHSPSGLAGREREAGKQNEGRAKG